MKILHISTGFPISYQGGITNYVRAIAESQVCAGHNVFVLCGPGSKGTFSFHIQEYHSDKIIPYKWKAPKDPEKLKQIKDFIDKEQFDIIHVHMALDVDWNLYDILKPYIYIISLHDYYFLCPRIQMIKGDRSHCSSYEEKKCSQCISLLNMIRFFNGLEYRIRHQLGFKSFRLPPLPQRMTKNRFLHFKQLLEGAKVLLPVSNRVKEIFCESGIDGLYKVLHIGNITADEFKKDFFWDESKKIIDVVMLGTLSYIKGADLFIKIAEKLDKKRFKIHFYGRSQSYAKKIRNAGIIDHGPYKQSDLGTLLNNMDLGLVLSVWEDNAPQVVMEFLNNHVPVVGTRLGGIPDFVNERNGILFNPYSEDDFSRMINSLNCLSREDIKKMKMNIVPTTTTQEHMRALNDVYEQVYASKKI